MSIENENITTPQENGGPEPEKPDAASAEAQEPTPVKEQMSIPGEEPSQEVPEAFPQAVDTHSAEAEQAYLSGQDPDAPGYPYNGYAAPEQYYAQEQEPPKKSNKALFIVLGVVGLIVVLLIAAFALGLGGGSDSGGMMKIPDRNKDPEGYLNAVYHNTMLELEESASMIDLEKFQGKPVSHDFAIAFDPSEFVGYMPSTEVGITGSLKIGIEQQKMLFNMGVTAAFFNFSDNQLYISPDVIAASIPTLYSKHKYITIDTENFADDYMDSEYYSPSDNFPEDLDLKAIITEMFASSSGYGGEAYTKFEAQLNKHVEVLEEAAQFKDEGTVTETINGKSVEVSKMSYTYPAAAVDNFYLAFLDEYEEYLISQMRVMSLMDPSVDIEEQVAYMMEELDSIEFTSALAVRYTIRDDQIVRIEADRFDFTVHDDTYGDQVWGFEFFMDLLGEESVWDNVRLDVVVYDDDDDAVEFILDVFNHDKDGTYSRKFKLEFIDHWDGDTIEMDLNFEWTPDSADERNFRITFEGYNAYATVGLRLAGYLEDSAEELSLTKGRFSVYEDDTTYFELDVEYKLYEIDESELDIDLEDSISFFGLSDKDFSSMFF